MSKSRESDMSNKPEGKKRPELALIEVAWNVLSTNIEFNTPRALAVNLSQQALNSLRGGVDTATIHAYDGVERV
jgi:hypothetical protein